MALCGLVNIAPSVMFHSMFRNCHKTEVFDPIVNLITINMMNGFFLCKRSAKMCFHNLSVLMNTFSIITDSFISTCVNPYMVVRWFFMQSSISAESYIVSFAKAFSITISITIIYLANIRSCIIRLNPVKSSIITQSIIMLLTKIFSIMDSVTIFYFAFADFFITRITNFVESSITTKSSVMFSAKPFCKIDFTTTIY